MELGGWGEVEGESGMGPVVAVVVSEGDSGRRMPNIDEEMLDVCRAWWPR